MMRRLLNILAALSLASALNVLMLWAAENDHPPRQLLGAVALAVLPVVRGIVAWRRYQERRRRTDHGLCRACGYDLRASTDRCPECGRPFEPHEKITVPRDHRSTL